MRYSSLLITDQPVLLRIWGFLSHLHLKSYNHHEYLVLTLLEFWQRKLELILVIPGFVYYIVGRTVILYGEKNFHHGNKKTKNIFLFLLLILLGRSETVCSTWLLAIEYLKVFSPQKRRESWKDKRTDAVKRQPAQRQVDMYSKGAD